MANFLYFRNYIRFFNSTFDQKFDTANSIRNLHVNVQEITILVSDYVVFFSLAFSHFRSPKWHFKLLPVPILSAHFYFAPSFPPELHS